MNGVRPSTGKIGGGKVDTSDIPEASEEWFKKARLVKPKSDAELNRLHDAVLKEMGGINPPWVTPPGNAVTQPVTRKVTAAQKQKAYRDRKRGEPK
jgi:hypothetical protein